GECERLLAFRGGKTVIVAAAEVAATLDPKPLAVRSQGTSRPYCRIEGLTDGNIGFQLWLPRPEDWSGRVTGAGVGGSGGLYNLADLARGVDQGFAAITTDSGHKASEVHWMLDRKKAQDYAHRAEHLVALAGKEIVKAYYGRPARYAYFIGCS